MAKSSINCNVRVVDCEGFSNDITLVPNATYTLVIDYPFDKWGYYKIKSGKNGMGLGRLLRKIWECYTKQYDAAKTDDNQDYWHGIDDLFVEGIDIDHKKREIRLSMGS